MRVRDERAPVSLRISMNGMLSLYLLRLGKLTYAAVHPSCWRSLCNGVAPSIEHRAALSRLSPDLLLDVGANRGQFSLMAKILMPRLPIHAYEPLRTEAQVYRKIHGSRSDVRLHEIALGMNNENALIHISKSADSSSLLPIGARQLAIFPETAEVGSEMIKVAALDSFVDHWCEARNALLKIDVQGFELKVLMGARSALKHCRYVYVECSSVPLYTGQALVEEVSVFLSEEGFRLKGTFNEWMVEGAMVQADYLFERGG